MRVVVKNAPTQFGRLSYRIESHIDQGFLEAVVEPLPRGKPACLVLRLRHPDGKPMRTVTVNGNPSDRFDVATETVTFAPSDSAVIIRATY
jgi:hypothetical protein